MNEILTTLVYRIPRNNISREEYLTQSMTWSEHEDQAALFTDTFAMALAKHLTMVDAIANTNATERSDGYWHSYQLHSTAIEQ